MSSTPTGTGSGSRSSTATEISAEIALQQPQVSTGVTIKEALPPWYPKYKGRHIYHGNGEAFAWALDGVGRAIAFMGSAAFLSTAVINLAKEAAGCETEPPSGETLIPDCDKKIYGLKPSSMLTTYTLIVGVTSTAILPLMGAIIDYTPHRRLVGRVTSFLFTILILPQIFISEDTFFAVVIIQIFVSFLGWMQTGITYAYLPELTTDELVLNDYTKNFTVTSFSSVVVYIAAIIGVVSALGLEDDSTATARIGMSVAFVMSGAILILAWGYLFQKRPEMQKLPEGQSLWSAGFIQLYHTVVKIYKNYRALKWFYIAIAFSDAGLQALFTIAITYLTDQLQFTARENGIAILVMLLGSVPGGFLANVITKRFDPVRSSQSALLTIIINTALFAIFLKGPGQQLETYILAGAWGIGTGWKWTSDRLLASSIIPEGQDAELMGLFLFSGQCLSWIPPLVFTAINEAGISQQIGVASLDAYFLISLVAYIIMGSYTNARKEVNRETAFDSLSFAEPNTHVAEIGSGQMQISESAPDSQPSPVPIMQRNVHDFSS
jgi:UMF1 family MFS transporter